MPKGVEHCWPAMRLARPMSVFSSLMPKGVEHSIRVRVALIVHLVFSSLMPKGVEHKISRPPCPPTAQNVFSSLMPKGVEHIEAAAIEETTMRVFISDAERR